MKFSEAEFAALMGKGNVRISATIGRRVIGGHARVVTVKPGMKVAAARPRPGQKTPLEQEEETAQAFLFQLRVMGLPEPTRQYRFHPTRRFKADFAWKAQSLLLEVDGGVWEQGRHNRGAGFIRDQLKRNEAVLLGWRVLHVVPADVKSGAAARLIERALKP